MRSPLDDWSLSTWKIFQLFPDFILIYQTLLWHWHLCGLHFDLFDIEAYSQTSLKTFVTLLSPPMLVVWENLLTVVSRGTLIKEDLNTYKIKRGLKTYFKSKENILGKWKVCDTVLYQKLNDWVSTGSYVQLQRNNV